tara:strand:- start:564 stop:1292 length:729 start_codon:yes stop_codon:yes gene_type:complete
MGASGDTTTVPSGASLVVASGATINITGATQTGFPSAGFADTYSTVAASATYTVPTDITKLLVIITGGGGGGAPGHATGGKGSGGCGATTVMARVTVVAADTITIVIGAGGAAATPINDGNIGGDSTFTHATGSGSGSMSTITAPGGKPGKYVDIPIAPLAGTVGANNEGISILGGYSSFAPNASNGGATFWGGGGIGTASTIAQATAGTAYGSGGGGGTATASWNNSEAGANGVCFIMEFK